MGDSGALSEAVDAVVDAVNKAGYEISAREQYSTVFRKNLPLVKGGESTGLPECFEIYLDELVH